MKYNLKRMIDRWVLKSNLLAYMTIAQSVPTARGVGVFGLLPTRCSYWEHKKEEMKYKLFSDFLVKNWRKYAGLALRDSVLVPCARMLYIQA